MMIYHIRFPYSNYSEALCGQRMGLFDSGHFCTSSDFWGDFLTEKDQLIFRRCPNCIAHPDFPISDEELGIILLAEATI